MKATVIMRRIDNLGKVVISKEIRRILRIREDDPLHTPSTVSDHFVLQYIPYKKATAK